MSAVLWALGIYAVAVVGIYVVVTGVASVVGNWRARLLRDALAQARAERDAWRTLAHELARHVATLAGKGG